MAYRTEQAYLRWIRQYIAYHDRRHPRDLGPAEVEQFLTHLAVARKVSAGIQHQALLFLYRRVLRWWVSQATSCMRLARSRPDVAGGKGFPSFS